MNQSTDKPSTSEMLGELAAMENDDGSPAFPMLRTKCKSFIPPCPHGEDDCPGWRAKTLDEVRLCLEELLVTENVAISPESVVEPGNWRAQRFPMKAVWANTPTEAVIGALYEASKVKV